MKNLIVLIVLLLGSQLRAQDSLWQKVYHSSDYINSSRGVSNYDGGLVVAGQQNFKSMLYNIDSLGNIVWSRGYGNLTESYFSDVINTKDSTFVVAGVESDSAESVINCVKFNLNGDSIWSRSFACPDPNYTEKLPQIRETNDSCYILSWTFSNQSKLSIVKLNHSGNVIWDRIITDSISSKHSGIAIANDSTYFAFSSIQNDGVLTKLDSSGTLLWSRKYIDHIFWDAECIDNSIYLTHSQPNLGILKTDLDGNINWSIYYSNLVYSDPDHFPSSPTLTILSDSSLTIQTDYSFQSFVVKVDTSGNFLSSNGFWMFLTDVIAADSGKTFVMGNGPFIGVKNPFINHLGIVKTDKNLITTDCSVDLPWVQQMNDQVIIDTIYLSDSSGINSTINGFNYHTFSPEVDLLCVQAYGNIQENTSLSVNVYPNIVENKVNFELTKFGTYHLTIIDLNGRTLKQKKFTGEATEVLIEYLPSGMYLYNITGESDHVSGRLMKK